METNVFMIFLTKETQRPFCMCDHNLSNCHSCENHTLKKLGNENEACDNHTQKLNMARAIAHHSWPGLIS